MFIQVYQGRQLASKWAKTEALLSERSIVPHIPPTRKYSPGQLYSMLQQHGMVVVKPIVGTGGGGVIKVVRENSGYSHTYRNKTYRVGSFQALAQALRSRTRKRRYLIQKGIHLATVNGRPIDYRVKYVKTHKGWEYRALVGRIAKRGLFVTNLSQGGDLVSASQGIRASLGSAYVKEKKAQMRALTVLSTRVLERKFPGIGQLGFDYGIDRQGKIWIFEVNTRPH
ncbi:YheC/YheD family protein [Paenibacillus sp. LHD-117]|uniref:YheC/YheD family protein n=1 Tax=Paenibacillus sp. LHD-117 TaxID=3071412 RepID=UPI0027E05BED|nr:YheC/YheD family protein [Paenibacillus sp. LHD-117]MDQ6419867.1 YheC/YheD family protein [Paenibacillus sp. LHD-117]